MNKIISILGMLSLLSGSLLAEYEQDGSVDGYKVYQKNCKKCHIEMITVTETMKRVKTLTAPPMVEVSTRLKENILLKETYEEVKRELVLTFMRDYIMHPNIDKSMCRLGAIDRFGVMPSQKGIITEDESHAVTEWIYDHYTAGAFK